MKRFILTFGLAVGLGSNALAAGSVGFGVHGRGGGFYGGYYGGHWHGGSFAPGFALGLGVGALWAYPWGAWDYCAPYGYGYYYPGYTYVYPPAVSVAPASPVTSGTARAEAPQPAPVPEAPAWVPSSPGAGAWVPDPEPYNFTPEQPTTAKSSAVGRVEQTTSITTSAGGVPVYSNVQAPGR